MSGYRNSSVVSDGGQSNLAPGTDPIIDNLPEAVDDDTFLDIDGAIGRKSKQRIRVK